VTRLAPVAESQYKPFMRSVQIATFLISLAAGFGCAITDYKLPITDDDGFRGSSSGDGPLVDTHGKAKIYESSQIATLWPDGSDELINFIDQKADSTATLTTYNNHSTGVEPTYHTNLYCNTGWSGCAIFTAPDVNDENLFDGRLNTSCAGARSLSLLISTGRYYGECGRQQARLGVEDKLALLGGAVRGRAFGRSGLLWELDGSNTSIRARNLETGQVVRLPDHGVAVDLFVANGGRAAAAALWLDHAMLGPALRDFANRLDDELHAKGLEVTLSYNGISSTFHVAGGAQPEVNAEVWRRRANSSF